MLRSFLRSAAAGLLLLVALLALPPAASAKGCPAVSAGGAGTHRLVLTAHGGLSCASATAITRDFFFKRGRTRHGGRSNAQTSWTLKRWPGWRCGLAAGGGGCTRGGRRVTYEVRQGAASKPRPKKPAVDPAEAALPVRGAIGPAAAYGDLEQRGFELGAAEAPVTIVEFIDYQCPFCANYHRSPDHAAVLDRLVRTGRAKLLLAPIALAQMGEDSLAARNVAARLAVKSRAWDFTDAFFAQQGDEATGYVTNPFLEGLVAGIPGTAPGDANREGDDATRAALAAADRLFLLTGATGTPSFAVGPSGGPGSAYRLVKFDGTSWPSAIEAAVG